MHHLVVKTNLFDSDSDSDTNKLKLGYGGSNERPLCPKPRRLVGPAIPDFLKPHRCSNHSQSSTDSRSGILNMIPEKSVERRDCVCSGCVPGCYSGSPPGRTGNPLVHDVRFAQYQVELLSPLTGTTKLCDQFGLTSSTSSV